MDRWIADKSIGAPLRRDQYMQSHTFKAKLEFVAAADLALEKPELFPAGPTHLQ